MERLNLTGTSHNWDATVFHTYGGIHVTSSVTPYGYWDTHSYTHTYPLSNLFSEGGPTVSSVFASANSAGQLVFDLPTTVYVEFLRIYPYCGENHDRYVGVKVQR